MKKSVRLCIAIVILAVSLFFFFGKVIQFDFETSIRENMISEMIAEITGDEDLIEEEISVKEAVDAAIEAIDDGMADDSMEEILDDNDDLEEGLDDLKGIIKTIRDSGLSYMELGRLMNFMNKYDSFLSLPSEDQATVNGIKIFSYIMVGLALFWAVVGVLLALANKGAGFVLYMIHSFLNLIVSILLKFIFESTNSDVIVTQPIAPICSFVIALVLVIFWFSTKKKVVE
ncbi:hypothetical protein [Butyrivibrio sp. TB]|uniref:hypothetical protein n=1 Tax=Butyrivibrio sp. TB TaxID=1520809 RepID=UPI0008BF85F4|nr:hypothetical protein [Butyrivibrio sp. TB]SEP76996.1 hypothetical protein SAMN02910382_00970 [Butyrivibrio sp. TB]